ncbi:MAG: glycosyltransferase [Candidatus Omnitrophica bacterium]|nr:glycosyltransferase [Candidatus Omnitrophota bacterium]
MKLSVLMPVYNEKDTVLDILDLVMRMEVDKEIILVDDNSTDGTREILQKEFGEGKDNVRVFYHQKNLGKGAAVRTALGEATGDYMIVQDADLEYSPRDIEKMFLLARDNSAKAVFGSRFLETWRSTNLFHYAVNRFFTSMTNILYGSALTDIHTCYKMVEMDTIRGLDIHAERFAFDPELCAKLLKSGISIEEVAISYRGRDHTEGKKIGWLDGFEALWTLIRFKFHS